MAFWQNSTITQVYEGAAPNDGTGDSIRYAFGKVNNNFSNISNYLAQSSIDFQNANVELTLNASYANIASLNAVSTTGNNASYSANVSAVNLVGNVYTYGASYFGGNLNATTAVLQNVTTGNIVPIANLQYNLGSPTNFFKNLYVGTLNQVNTLSLNAAASLLELQSNLIPGSAQDVGVVTKYNITSGSNAWGYFGYQNSSNAFIYVSGMTADPTTYGNSVIVGGSYGNVHFGSQLLSNSTPSVSSTTGALVVTGGVGVGGNVTANVFYGNIVSGNATVANLTITSNIQGNLNVNGIISSTGYPVIVASPTFVYGTPYTGGAISGNTIFLSAASSTSATTGAVTIPNGGLGVGGSVYSNGGFFGQLTGLVATANQPYITGLGTLGNLTISNVLNGNTIQAVSVGATSITASSLIVTTSLTGLSSLTVSGNITANLIGSVYGTVQTATQPYITSIGSLLTLATNSVLSSSLNVTSGIYDSGIRVVSTSSGTGNLTISNSNINLTSVNAGYTSIGSANQIPVITTDQFGRVITLTTVGVLAPEYLNISGNTGTANVALLSNTVVIAGGVDTTTTASGNTVIINGTSTLATVTGRGATTSTAVTFNGQINTGASVIPTASNTYSVGNSTYWYSGVYAQNFYGTSTTAKYADLAEMYLTDTEYEPGTVVVVGGSAEVTACNQFGQDNVIGVVSTNPAYKMNSDLVGGTYIALKGRVPVKVYGPILKGQRLGTSTQSGYACYARGAYSFAISLVTDMSDGAKTIEAIIL